MRPCPAMSRGSPGRQTLSRWSRGDAPFPLGLPQPCGTRGFICLAAKGRSLQVHRVPKVTLLAGEHCGAFQRPQQLRSERGTEEVQSTLLPSRWSCDSHLSHCPAWQRGQTPMAACLLPRPHVFSHDPMSYPTTPCLRSRGGCPWLSQRYLRLQRLPKYIPAKAPQIQPFVRLWGAGASQVAKAALPRASLDTGALDPQLCSPLCG